MTDRFCRLQCLTADDCEIEDPVYVVVQDVDDIFVMLRSALSKG
ncbi:MAG: hypothetical protein JWO89_2056, partial [Verrucomicrobiaceae bacterium]|nr:hypothetical protein [Verrucomicrobiaceae bacterium]